MRNTLSAALILLTGATAHAEMSEGQQRAACGGDVMRLCWSHIPNRSAIGDCMVAKRTQLGASCRAVVDAGLAEKARAAKVAKAPEPEYSREMASR